MNRTPRPNVVLQVAQQPQDLGLHHHVERRRRLVGDEQLRVARERERDQDALALAARELVRVVGRAPRGQPDELEQLADAVAARGAARRRRSAARSPRRSGDRPAAPG